MWTMKKDGSLWVRTGDSLPTKLAGALWSEAVADHAGVDEVNIPGDTHEDHIRLSVTRIQAWKKVRAEIDTKTKVSYWDIWPR